MYYYYSLFLPSVLCAMHEPKQTQASLIEDRGSVLMVIDYALCYRIDMHIIKENRNDNLSFS